jgi:hypothetical protein
VQRDRIDQQLRKNPSLKARRVEAVTDAYRRARFRAYGETDLPLETFPETCPYDWDTILNRPFQR